jgi:PAT family beta-lactamase induction signal transducer AmpG
MSIYTPSSLVLITLGVAIEKFFFGFGAVGFMIYLMQQLHQASTRPPTTRSALA